MYFNELSDVRGNHVITNCESCGLDLCYISIGHISWYTVSPENVTRKVLANWDGHISGYIKYIEYSEKRQPQDREVQSLENVTAVRPDMKVL